MRGRTLVAYAAVGNQRRSGYGNWGRNCSTSCETAIQNNKFFPFSAM